MTDETNNAAPAGQADTSPAPVETIDQLRADSAHMEALHDDRHPGHAHAVSRMAKAYQARTGETTGEREPNPSNTPTASEMLSTPDPSRDYGNFDDLKADNTQTTNPEFEDSARQLFGQLDMEPADGRTLVQLNNMAAAGRLDIPEGPDEAAAALHRDFGPAAEQALADARKLVSKLPTDWQSYLAETGLGNHPGVVSILARQAAKLKAAGKL